MKSKTLVFLGNNRSAGNMVNETLRYRLWQEGYVDRQFHLHGRDKARYADLIAADEINPHWLLTGHLTYGVHSLIGRKIDYFMNIREAGDRLISKFQQWGGSADPEKFISSDFDLDNSVTKRLAGYCLDENDQRYIFNLVEGRRVCRIEDFKVTEEIYQEALKNSQNVTFTIVKERLAESLVLLEEFYNLPPIFCFRFFNFNRSSRRIKVSGEFTQFISELNVFDNKFYAQYDEALTERLNNANPDSKKTLEARVIAMNTIARIDKEFDTDTEANSIKKVLALSNDLFAKGKESLAFEVLYLILVNPSVNQSIRENLIAQVNNLPGSYEKDKLLHRLQPPPTLSSRWL